MRLTQRRGPRDEQGNLIVAMAVLMVLTLLSMAVFTRTLAGLHSSRQGQDFGAALGQADAGLSDATFRMDQLGTTPASTFCIGPSPTNSCVAPSLPGAPNVVYVAQRVDDNTVTVYSKGLVNGQPHAIKATVTRSAVFPFAIFAKSTATFNGNSGGSVQAVDANGNPCSRGGSSCNGLQAQVGSNGLITCNPNNISPGDGEKYYKGGGASCANAGMITGSYNPLPPQNGCNPAPAANIPPTPCAPTSPSPSCPTDSTGNIEASIPAGVYECSQEITFPAGPVTPQGGEVDIYVFPPAGSLAMAFGRSQINVGGNPTQMRVYISQGNIDPGTGSNNGSFTGILYAPNSDFTSDGCKANWDGSVVVNTFTCNGGPNQAFRYDSRAAGLVEAFWNPPTDYTEIPSSQVVLP